ncbi:MAG: hypothetical protein ABS35_31610 [Kaistia sp. SCN 65-12]|jgi:uncharacterized protein (DUF305 family)|nr:MAG: hypothetical protein ABS35_31610 [Kaistia sp. SCN 65-12]
MKTITLGLSILCLLAVTPSVFAQEAAAPLPEICMTDAGKMAADSMPAMPMAHEMDEAHTALMMGMEQTNKDMMMGQMAADIDVAFACSMIPHHQAAINMAKAELQYGDDDWAKQAAQKIIDAQEKEIAEFKAWLEKQPK